MQVGLAKVGDLVKPRQSFRNQMGLVLAVVSQTKTDKYLLVQWNGWSDWQESIHSCLLEVISESR